jgi:hypothetical protein
MESLSVCLYSAQDTLFDTVLDVMYVQQHVDRRSVQMVLTPCDLFSWNRNMISKNNSEIINTLITWSSYLVKKTAHSVPADPSSLHPTCLVFLVIAHFASALADHWLLIFPASWGAGPSLAPFPQADPNSLRSQATACSHVGHRYILWKTSEYINFFIVLYCKTEESVNHYPVIYYIESYFFYISLC